MFSMRTKMKSRVRKLIFQVLHLEIGFNWEWFVKKHSQFDMGKGT